MDYYTTLPAPARQAEALQSRRHRAAAVVATTAVRLDLSVDIDLAWEVRQKITQKHLETIKGVKAWIEKYGQYLESLSLCIPSVDRPDSCPARTSPVYTSVAATCFCTMPAALTATLAIT